MKLIDDKKQKLNQICIDLNVKKLYLFGSILTNEFKDDNDIDMLIQFSVIDLNNYMDFKEKMELLFNRPVDLVENQAIKNPVFRKVVDKEKQLIYG